MQKQSLIARVALTAIAAAMISNAAIAAKTATKAKETPVPKGPSLHVQCDGFPNNMTAGESAARLLGAVTLLGLFAPPPESADPKARKFGQAGVDACTSILAGDKSEGNGSRRVELTIARAIHQIEAKNYDAALGDVAVARSEADKAGLSADPLYNQSVGLTFDELEGAALIRLGKKEEALKASMRQFDTVKYQLFPLLALRSYPNFFKDDHPQIAKYNDQLTRMWPGASGISATRMEDVGKFADAAKLREAMIDYHLSFVPENKSSLVFASAALANAMAGNWDQATKRAGEARDNIKARIDAGKPEDNRSDAAEMLDLYEVFRLFHSGDAAGARRIYIGRSAWTAPSLGAVMQANRLLRPGAPAGDLAGSLAKTPDQMWADREAEAVAQRNATDGDNKTLFGMIRFYDKASNWESLSKQVYNIQKSKILGKPNEKNKLIPATLYAGYTAKYDGILLHSAMVAKSKGDTALVFIPVIENAFQGALVRMGKAGDVGIAPEMALNPDDVITALRDLIPSPDILKARKAVVKK